MCTEGCIHPRSKLGHPNSIPRRRVDCAGADLCLHKRHEGADDPKFDGFEELWEVLCIVVNDRLRRIIEPYLWTKLEGRVERDQYVGTESLSMPEEGLRV